MSTLSAVSVNLVRPGRRLAAVDGLRGLFAWSVVLIHWVGFIYPHYDYGSWYSKITLSMAMMSVCGFYIISGYVLLEISSDYWAFLKRRCKRLLPMHVLCILMGAMILGAPTGKILQEIGFGYGLRSDLDGPDWSLRVEMLATVVWPVIAVASRSIWGVALLGVLCVLASPLWPDLDGFAFFALGAWLKRQGAVLPDYRLLLDPMVQFIGRISFSLYMTHYLVLEMCGPFGLTLVFPAAWLTWYLVEQPSLRWSRS